MNFKSRYAASLAALALLACVAGRERAAAQLLPDPIPENPAILALDSNLWAAEQLAAQHVDPQKDADRQSVLNADLQEALAQRRITMRPDRKVHIEIVGPHDGVALPWEDQNAVAAAAQPDLKTIEAAIQANGGEIMATWQERFSLWAPVDSLSNLAAMMPAGYFVAWAQEPNYDEVPGEGPGVQFSAGYRDAGADGTGVTIGLIDGGFDRFGAARGNGDAPPAAQTTITNYTAFTFDNGGAGNNRHGTGCVEAIYDHAPGATYRIYKTGDVTHVGNAVANMIADQTANGGPHVISHSMSWYNLGWADNTGAACAAAINAANAGILFFTSAGNRARSHYQATFAPRPGRNWHAFSGGDETNNVVARNGSRLQFYLSWDDSDNVTDYDLYIYNDAITVELAKSTNAGAHNFEFCTYTYNQPPPTPMNPNPPNSVTVHVGVLKRAGNNREFELFDHNGSQDWEYVTAVNSTTSPSNTSYLSVFSVGAVRHGNFNSAPGTTGIIESYSSRGPSNSGLMLPDVCGPTNTATFSYGVVPAMGPVIPGPFGGTSCATPNCAGCCAALWSANPAKASTIIRDAIRPWALAFRDWNQGAGGAPDGRDNTYGWGGMVIPRVRLDILPNRNPNPIYRTRDYTVYVAVLASDNTFLTPGATLNYGSLRFGRRLSTASAPPTSLIALARDFNNDGIQDRMFGFRTLLAGFQIGDTRGVLKGDFTNQAPFAAADAVVVNP